MFMARSSICMGVFGMASFSLLMRTQGSSFRYRMGTSKVAPPHTSNEKKPIWSMVSAIGSISSVRMRVASMD